jgi:phosphatidylserine/phosphatidylglycerophosphate/cardiolipin synthase-like enzyme
MNHGKAMTVDDKVGLLGSDNFTWRGKRYDDESAVHFNDEEMVKDLNTIFATWKETAQPFNEEKWKRSLLHRVQVVVRKWKITFSL